MEKNVFQPFWLIGQEEFDRVVAFSFIARLAGKCQVAGPVGSFCRERGPWSARNDMLNLEWDVRCIAVSALTAPFFEQILAQLVARQRSLLISDTGDLGVLHLLQIEPDSLDFN